MASGFFCAALAFKARRRALRSLWRGFSIIEFLVLIGVIAVLISIFIPYLSKTRETESRTRCAHHLAAFSYLLREYAKENSFLLPSTPYDSTRKPNGYTAFTGPDDPDPFSPQSKVAANDVTASLFLLMRYGYISNGREIGLSMYICPSSSDVPDTLTDTAGRPVAAQQRSNFRSPHNLSYGYCSPFSSAPKFRMNTDWLAPTFAVMADKSPGINPPDFDVTAPALGAPASEIRKANSSNHGGAGQNVLFGDGHVDFKRTPYCGYHDTATQPDNIYTAAAPAPTTAPFGQTPIRGYFGRRFAPASWEDSYLVPSENDRD